MRCQVKWKAWIGLSRRRVRLWDGSDRLTGAPPGSRGDAGDALVGGTVVDLVVLKKRSHGMGNAFVVMELDVVSGWLTIPWKTVALGGILGCMRISLAIE